MNCKGMKKCEIKEQKKAMSNDMKKAETLEVSAF